jgi:hypothetical protein
VKCAEATSCTGNPGGLSLAGCFNLLGFFEQTELIVTTTLLRNPKDREPTAWLYNGLLGRMPERSLQELQSAFMTPRAFWLPIPIFSDGETRATAF